MRSAYDSKSERGFVLVTSIVLLSVLTILGVGSLYKSNIEIKVSAGSVQAEQAFSAAQAGLDKMYKIVVDNQDDIIIDRISKGIGTIDFYLDKHFETLTDGAYKLAGSSAAVDAWVIGSNANVYTLDGTMSEGTAWGTGSDPQVAVWLTSYKPPTSAADYPYLADKHRYVNDPSIIGGISISTDKCTDCLVVAYAVGRSGNSYRMLREMQGKVDVNSKLSGASAFTNAPKYNGVCGASLTASSSIAIGNSTGNDSLIEVTQAPYTIADRNSPASTDFPSGVAIVSNTQIVSSKNDSYKDNLMYPAFNQSSVIVFSTHKNDGSDAVRFVRDRTANNGGTMETGGAMQPASGKLTTNLVRAGLLGGDDEVKYFDIDNEPLFNIDAYRWGAEQFTCQNINGTNSARTANTRDGKYCLKGDALRRAMWTGSKNTLAPITGRLTLGEYLYNVSNAIPMFGIVRVMMPATVKTDNRTGDIINCTINGKNYPKYEKKYDFRFGGSTLNNTTSPGSNLGPDAKTIVYGTLIYDFFDDSAGSDSDVFEPETEKLLTPFNIFGDSRILTAHPVYVNPVMPRTVLSGANADFPGVSVGLPGNDVSLASPSGGYFPRTEGMIGTESASVAGGGATDVAGNMAIIHELVAIGVAGDENSTTTPATTAATLFEDNHTRLKYYYAMLVKSTPSSDANMYPIADFPSSGSYSSTKFCIGSEDCGGATLPAYASQLNNEGDKFHLLFPSGYVHGWKVALAALNVKADEWNDIFVSSSSDGIADLKTDHTPPFNATSTTKGSPFNDDDEGFSATGTLLSNSDLYFNITKDAGSGYGLLDSEFADLPALMYTAGILGIYQHSNVSGAMYSSSSLQLEPGSGDGQSYTNGAIITSGGWYFRRDGEVVVVYGPGTIDNANTSTTTPSVTLLRANWQELK